MDADPDRDRVEMVDQRRLCGALLERERAPNGASNRGEDDVEAVAFGLDFGPVKAHEDPADERPIRAQELGSLRVASSLDEACVVAEVREEEAVCPRGGRTIRHLVLRQSLNLGRRWLPEGWDGTSPAWTG